MSLPGWINESPFDLLDTQQEIQQPERKKSRARRLHDEHMIPLPQDALLLQSEHGQHTTQIGVAGQ